LSVESSERMKELAKELYSVTTERVWIQASSKF
jgi:hypothetical protein